MLGENCDNNFHAVLTPCLGTNSPAVAVEKQSSEEVAPDPLLRNNTSDNFPLVAVSQHLLGIGNGPKVNSAQQQSLLSSWSPSLIQQHGAMPQLPQPHRSSKCALHNEPSARPSCELCNAARAEVFRQMMSSNFKGKVWLSEWQRRYQPKLGPFRPFLERQPEFRVTSDPKAPHRFSIQFADSS